MHDAAEPRLLHVAETITGGVSSYLQEIVAFQKEALGDGNIRLLVPRSQATELGGIDNRLIIGYPRSGRNVRSLISFSMALNEAIRRFRPTIVHLHSSFAGAVARPLLQLVRPKPHVVYCAHGWSFLIDIPAWKRRAYALIERGLCPLTDILINISRYEDQQARAHGLSPEKCVVVRNAISPGPAPGMAESPFDERFVNLLFVGRFDRQKGLDLLLRAMQRLQDTPIRLHVIGSCVHEAKAVHPPDNVRLLGWMPRHTLDAYYAAADGLVVPSRWEGFGLVAIEAMRNGTAVIASRRGSLPELIDDGKTGYLFHLDETDLSELERVLRSLDKQRLRQMGTAAAQHFNQFFTADAMNRGLLDVYAKLHARRTRDRPVLQWSRSNL